MKLTFLGTRGNIDIRSRRQRRHTSTLVSFRGAVVMIDCGADWLEALHRVNPGAIVLTHAHPDHVGGLRRGTPCPVYAPSSVWNAIERWPIANRLRLASRHPTEIRGILFEAFPLEHSVIAPAVGYRITAGSTSLFYAPDVLKIRHARRALDAIAIYVGDGATITRPIVRTERRRHVPVGHASIAMQLDWCNRAGVGRAVFTHCGRAVVANYARAAAEGVELGRAVNIDARIARDGLEIVVSG